MGQDCFEISKCNSHVDYGWKKVVSRKRNRKKEPANNVLRSIEEQDEDRIRGILVAKMVSADVEDDEIAARNENLKAEETKKPKLSFPEAMAEIDSSHLADFLAETAVTHVMEPEFQLVRLMDYLGKARSGVEFPWLQMFKGSPLSEMIDVPFSHIPEPVCTKVVYWMNQLPFDTLPGFVLWACGHILTDLAALLGGGKGAQLRCSKDAMFIVLAMVLRGNPNSLIRVLLPLRERRKYYLGQEKLPVIVWMMAQASQGDLSAGLYSWAHNLLPVAAGDKKCCNPKSRDLILQLVEKILSNPNARTILVNGKQLIPPSSFEILVRLTFPASSARLKATKRFEAIYPLLKEVALAGSKAKVTQQIFLFSLKLAGEDNISSKKKGNPVLAKEATSIAIWCLAENVDCCNHLDNLYKENLEATVVLLKKLVHEWKDHCFKLSSSHPRLNRIMKRFRLKIKKAITEGGDNASLYKEADKFCEIILGSLSRGSGKLAITAVVLAAAGAAAVLFLLSNPTN